MESKLFSRNLLKGLAFVVGTAILGSGCAPKTYYSAYNGDSVELTDDEFSSYTLSIKDINGNILIAKDNNHDKRYDSIDLSHVPLGNSLEAYADLNKLQEIHNSIETRVKESESKQEVVEKLE